MCADLALLYGRDDVPEPAECSKARKAHRGEYHHEKNYRLHAATALYAVHYHPKQISLA